MHTRNVLLPCLENIQHGYRPSAANHGGHHSIPFLHSGPLDFNLPQPYQFRSHLCFLEFQTFSFRLYLGDLRFRFKLPTPTKCVLCFESLLHRRHLRLDCLLEGRRELKIGDGELHNCDTHWT